MMDRYTLNKVRDRSNLQFGYWERREIVYVCMSALVSSNKVFVVNFRQRRVRLRKLEVSKEDDYVFYYYCNNGDIAKTQNLQYLRPRANSSREKLL